MPLDPHARRLLDMVAVAGVARSGIDDRRRAFRALMSFCDTDAPIGRVAERSLPGPAGPIGARLYTPLGAQDELLPGIVFCHGGGFVAGSLDTHDPLCRVLANETGCRIVAVDYRLAPEHPFPAAVDDVCAATRWVLDHAAELGLDAARVGVGGDSAGGALAAVACQAPGRKPAFQLLLCPITDFAGQTGSRRDFATGYLIDATTVKRDLDLYLVGAGAADPLVSPLRFADSGGLPPAYIHTAEFDPFRDEGEAYARRLRDAGVAVAHTCHRGMIHLFYAMPRVIPSARQATARIGAEIRGRNGP